MSIIKTTHTGWIISHRDYVRINVLEDDLNSNSSKVIKLNPDLFEIHCPFRSSLSLLNSRAKRMRKRSFAKVISSNSNNDTANTLLINSPSQTETDKLTGDCDSFSSTIQKISDEIIREGRELGLFQIQSESEKSESDNNLKARKAANNFYELISSFKKFPKFVRDSSGNSVGVKMILFDEMGNFQKFVIAEHSSVYCDDVEHLNEYLGDSQQFSLIIMDPPWRNKYIRRRKRKQSEAGYQMMDDRDIGNIPIKTMTKDKALVAIWCTNSEMHQREVIDKFFPSWGVQYLATWYWLKVTTGGVPVCPFNLDTKKQPYESIILGRKNDSSASSKCETASLQGHGEPLTPDPKIVISVPSSIHSHKPPLTEVLRPYIFESELNSTNCCEIFARYALPGFTCYGDEVVKLMHESLYISDREDDEKI